MTRLNLKNQTQHDDEKMVNLLRKKLLEFPSPEMTETIMSRIAVQYAERNHLYRPLKAPLYLMAAIALLLFIPFLIPLFPTQTNATLFVESSATTIWALIAAVSCWMIIVAINIVTLLLPRLTHNLNPFKL